MMDGASTVWAVVRVGWLYSEVYNKRIAIAAGILYW